MEGILRFWPVVNSHISYEQWHFFWDAPLEINHCNWRHPPLSSTAHAQVVKEDEVLKNMDEKSVPNLASDLSIALGNK
jgi:hypothetical protein